MKTIVLYSTRTGNTKKLLKLLLVPYRAHLASTSKTYRQTLRRMTSSSLVSG